MSDFSRPRGTRDFDPEEMRFRRRCERKMRKRIASFGYEEIATPAFEHSDLFIARSGPQILQQIYVFMDKGGREIVLRPELTVPVMRMYNSDLKSRPKPLRVQYFGNCFRYERPQKGRYREFWQMGVEYIGKKTPLANAEVINTAIEALEAVGSRGFVVRVGHVAILKKILKELGIEDSKDLMIAIDKKDRSTLDGLLGGSNEGRLLIDLIMETVHYTGYMEKLAEIKRTFKSIEEEDLEDLGSIMKMISSRNGVVEMDISITRGLDYYDSMVFEIDAPSLGAEKQICGGGSYSLTSVFGTEVEGIGFGLGFDRILVSLHESMGSTEESLVKVYMLPFGGSTQKYASDIARDLRDLGIITLMGTSGRSMKKAINYALAQQCTHLVIIGEDEMEKEGVSIKDLTSKEQIFVELEDLGMEKFRSPR